MISFFVSYFAVNTNGEQVSGNMVGLCKSRYVTIDTIREWEKFVNHNNGNKTTTVMSFQELIEAEE